MKAATIYERQGKLYLHSSSKTTDGLWIMNAPVLAVEKEDASAVGRALMECLAASREGIPHPKSFPKNLFNPVLDLAGVKSYRAFAESAKCVEVTSDGAMVTLIPTRNEGVKDGFAQLPNKTETGLGSDEVLGSAAVAALAMAG